MISFEWNKPDLVETALISSDHKYRDRERCYNGKIKLVNEFMPFLKEEKLKILDISCGNGVFVEMLQDWGHEVEGSEAIRSLYVPFHISQGIKCKYFNAAQDMYPYQNKEFDIVTCIGAMNLYKPKELWAKCADEMLRIAKKSVYIFFNIDSLYQDYQKMFENDLFTNCNNGSFIKKALGIYVGSPKEASWKKDSSLDQISTVDILLD